MYYKTGKETKAYLIELFKNCIDTKKDDIFVDELKNAIRHTDEYKILQNEWNAIEENYYAQELLIDYGENEFKKACSVWSNHFFFYCISNIGRIVIVKKENVKDFEITEKLTFKHLQIGRNAWYISIKDGFLKEIHNFPYDDVVKIAKFTDVYKYLEYAGYLNDDDSIKLSNDWFSYHKEYTKKIDLHHINDNPNDNRLENLIYLPTYIHPRR